jgi:GTP cyclohydrolase I
MRESGQALEQVISSVESSAAEDPRDSLRGVLRYIGEDPDREGLIDTPSRMVRAWDKLFSGYRQDPGCILSRVFEDECDEMVVLRDIEFYSTCEHHFLTFFGRISIAYLPNKKVVGVSKLARLVECFSRRLQIQERMTRQIAEAIMCHLNPLGVGVVASAQHLCMTSRGVEKQNSVMVTSAMMGVFREDEKSRREFLDLIGAGK